MEAGTIVAFEKAVTIPVNGTHMCLSGSWGPASNSGLSHSPLWSWCARQLWEEVSTLPMASSGSQLGQIVFVSFESLKLVGHY